MKTSINYGASSFGPFEGNSVQEIIESHFSILESIILEKLGNAAGFNLDSVYAEYNPSTKTGELHVFASGSDTLLHHDSTQLVSKELIFTLPCITQSDLPERYDFELIEEEKFNPYSNPSNVSAKLGILEAAVDYMADITHQKRPAETLNSQMPNLRRESTQVYLTRLMMMFGFLSSKEAGFTANLKDLIQRMVISLQDVTRITYDKEADIILYYYKTMKYFQTVNKITALKYYREQTGKSQTEIANELGVSLRQYQRYEATNSTLPMANKLIAEKLAQILNVQPTDLVRNHLIVLK